MSKQKMSPQIHDLSGRVFGKLTVTEFDHVQKGGHAYWKCTCKCGTKKVVAGGNLKRGNTVSCGCHRKESRTTHGMTGTPEMKSYEQMIQRCTNPDNPSWPRYGGRGITVCKRWLKADNFFLDMGKRPRNTSLDRKDNEKGYCKGNCRWATASQQAKNRRTRVNRESSFKGVGWRKSHNRWVARIRVKGKPINLGSFKEEEDAINARKTANKKYGYSD